MVDERVHTYFRSLKDHIQRQTVPTIILISGKNQNQQHTVFGIFNAKKSAKYAVLEESFIFQLVPLHRMYHPLPSGTKDSMVFAHNKDPTIDVLKCQLGNFCLSISEDSSHFAAQNDQALNEEFHADAVETISV